MSWVIVANNKVKLISNLLYDVTSDSKIITSVPDIANTLANTYFDKLPTEYC